MIHKYELNGYFIVLDVNSGAVHVVDELVYNLLDYVDEKFTEEQLLKATECLKNKFSEQDIKDAFDDLKELRDAEQLFSSDDYEKYASMMVNSPIKSMCLHIAHDCNLRCKYCFASTGDFGQGRLLMSEEVGKKAIDFWLENSKGRHNLELDFFGGEPLMNFDVVKEVVKYARSKEKEYDKNFRF
ncbi:MAG: 4Fe-4S cluster-binding domain-containing protein, partial [Oscillospiraceae bacterium]